MRAALVLTGMLYLPQVAWGYEIPAKPEGCIRLAVAVTQSCEVRAIYRCEDAGLFWSEAHIDGALAWIGRSTLDYRDIGLVGVAQRMAIFSDPESQVSVLPQDVISSGHGALSFRSEWFMMGMTREISTTINVRYEGKSRVFRGVPYAEFDGNTTIVFPPPMGLLEETSSHFFNPASGVLLKETHGNMPGATHDPIIDILHPGDAGFDSNLPPESCQSISALGSDGFRRAA